MINISIGKQRVCLFHVLQYSLVSLIISQSFKRTRLFRQYPFSVNWNYNFKAIVIFAHIKVFDTMTRGGMNASGTGIKGNVIPGYNKRIPVKERVVSSCIPFQPRNFANTVYSLISQLHHIFQQFFVTIYYAGLDNRIDKIRVDRNGDIAGASILSLSISNISVFRSIPIFESLPLSSLQELDVNRPASFIHIINPASASAVSQSGTIYGFYLYMQPHCAICRKPYLFTIRAGNIRVSQSPTTPRRLNDLRWISRYFSANSSQAFLNFTGPTS